MSDVRTRTHAFEIEFLKSNMLARTLYGVKNNDRRNYEQTIELDIEELHTMTSLVTIYGVAIALSFESLPGAWACTNTADCVFFLARKRLTKYWTFNLRLVAYGSSKIAELRSIS